jgi:hypothetical protein
LDKNNTDGRFYGGIDVEVLDLDRDKDLDLVLLHPLEI